MTALAITSPLPQFFDLNGKPLEGGRIYFGQVGQNPETYPLTVYWDAAATQPASQPVPTVNGYTVRGSASAGVPAFVYADTAYSITVRDKRGRLVYSAPDSSAFSLATAVAAFSNSSDVTKGDALIAVKQPATGAVARTQHDKNTEFISVADFGASPLATGAANVAALKLAAAHISTVGGKLLIPPGNYTLDGASLGAYNAAYGSCIDFFSANGISIEGYGATFTCTDKLGQVWFRFRSCSNVTVAGLKFIGAQTGSGVSSGSGIPLYFDTAASDIVLRDLSGRYGYGLIEFQTDDLIPMGGVKYKNVTLRGIKTYAYYHAMELLHIDGLHASDISIQGGGSGNDISFRGMYLLHLSNANINGVRSFGNGWPGNGGYPIFLREYTKGGSSTFANYNCENVNFSDLALISCFCGGLEMNVAAGQIKNVNVSNLTITADNSNTYGGGLLEIAHDTAAPTGINNIKFSNIQITGSTTAGATCILYRNSSNVTTENTAFTDHQYVDVQVDGNACAPMLTGAGGWIKNLAMVNVRMTTTNLVPYITMNRIRDASFDRFIVPGKIDFSNGRMVRVEFTNSSLGTVLAGPADMAPIVVNGDALAAATITVNTTTGNDDNVGSTTLPLATLAEATRRVSKLTGGQTTVTISLPVNANYGALALANISNQINLRSPLGATITSINITNCRRVDVRNGLNCAGGVIVRNSSAFLESMTFAGATVGIYSENSRLTSSNNNFNGTTIGIQALSQSQVWSTADTGTASTYGYSVGEASVVYKEASSTLTGSTAQKQLVSAAVVNF